jgi:hypothetical protein
LLSLEECFRFASDDGKAGERNILFGMSHVSDPGRNEGLTDEGVRDVEEGGSSLNEAEEKKMTLSLACCLRLK